MGVRDTMDPVPVTIQKGVVVDSLSGPRWYNVRIGRETMVSCAAGASLGSQAMLGPAKINIYPPGTSVLVAIPVDSVTSEEGRTTGMFQSPGYILCAIPNIVGTAKERCSDWVAPFVGEGASEDVVHSYVPLTYRNQFTDFNPGHPLDSVPESDEGVLNEMGVGYGTTRFFSWLRAADTAGIWAFYLDKLVRISAYNYEFWTAGSEQWIKNDEGEVNDVELFTPYPWEGLGMLNPGEEALTNNATAGGGIIKPGQQQLWFEPKEVSQLMIPRLMRVRGYLGDAHRELVVLPKIKVEEPSEGEEAEPYAEAYSRETVYTGLLDIHKHTDGMYSVRSARGIHHEKYIFIPVPKQLAPPEESDVLADGTTNYKPAGYWGNGPRFIHTKWTWTWSDPERPDTWAAEMYDYNAFMFNWYNIKTTVAHTRDWFLPEEGYFPPTDVSYSAITTELPEGETSENVEAVYVPAARLSTRFVFYLPKFSEIKIDHRPGNSRYYYSRSLISQLPDGSILLEDGYGSSIHMTGGNINMSCAGDIWSRPGRSMVVWAPDDLILRGGSSVDITASNADVRIKAERNLHMISGNSGTVGGTLIESRSVYDFAGPYKFRDAEGNVLVGEDVDTYGIMFKTKNAPVLIYGADVYVKAISPNNGGGTDVGGNITLEADQDLVTSGYAVVHYAESGINEVLGQALADGGVVSGSSVVNRFDTDNAVFGARTLFRAQATNAVFDTSSGGVWAKGQLNLAGGVVPVPASTVTNIINQLSTAFTNWLNGGFVTLTNYLYNETYTKGIRGNPVFIDRAGFTCRNEDQYGLKGISEVEDEFKFFIVESRWQQNYRKHDIGLVWYEPTVEIPGAVAEFTRPHPGHEFWIFDEKYRIFDGTLFDWEKLKNVDRGRVADFDSDEEDFMAYDKAWTEQITQEVDKLKPKLLSNNYLISKQYGQSDY